MFHCCPAGLVVPEDLVVLGLLVDLLGPAVLVGLEVLVGLPLLKFHWNLKFQKFHWNR